MFACGVIEGFYGRPWSQDERLAWIDRLASFGMTRYVWAAKAEPRHRERWSEPFTEDELAGFEELASRSADVALGVGLTPGAEASADEVLAKLAPAVSAGASFVVLSCDDMPSLADGAKHRDLAHHLLDGLAVPVWVVPTHYCGTSASPYLESLSAGLRPEVEVMWTGAYVVDDTLTVADATQWSALAGRPPIVWDNTPVNDGMMTQALHLGPLQGREPGLRDAVRGVLWNPMALPMASTATLASAAAWLTGDDPVVAWERWVRQRGWYHLAVATAFPHDAHWAGGEPDSVFDDAAWWRALRDGVPERAADVGLDDGVQPWINAARDGAQLAVDALDAAARAGTRGAGNGTTLRAISLAMRWNEWHRRPATTFASGMRVRPVITQDERGEFVHTAATFAQHESPVDRLVQRALMAGAS